MKTWQLEDRVISKRAIKDIVDVSLAAVGLLLLIPLYQNVLIPLRGRIGVIELEVLKGSQDALNVCVDVLVYAGVPVIYLLVLLVYLTARWARKVEKGHSALNAPDPD